MNESCEDADVTTTEAACIIAAQRVGLTHNYGIGQSLEHPAGCFYDPRRKAAWFNENIQISIFEPGSFEKYGGLCTKKGKQYSLKCFFYIV